MLQTQKLYTKCVKNHAGINKWKNKYMLQHIDHLLKNIPIH